MATVNPPEVAASLRCEKCNKEFKTMRNYRTHQVQFHIGLCCYICGKNFSTLDKLETHKRVHDEPNEGKGYKSVWTLRAEGKDNEENSNNRGGMQKVMEKLEDIKRKAKKRQNLIDSESQFIINDDNAELVGTNLEPKTSSTLLKKGKPVVAQAREIASNVVDYFRKEAESGDILLPTSNWMKRAAMATGLSVNLLLHIRKEKEATGFFTTPGTRRPRECKITNLPNHEKKVIKEEMQRLINEGIPVTVDRLMPYAKEHTSFRGGRTSLWRIMKQVKKKHVKGKSKVISEDDCDEVDEPEDVESEPKELSPVPMSEEPIVVCTSITPQEQQSNRDPKPSAEALLMLNSSSTALTLTPQTRPVIPTLMNFNPHSGVSVTMSSAHLPLHQEPVTLSHQDPITLTHQEPVTVQLNLPVPQTYTQWRKDSDGQPYFKEESKE